MMKVPLSEIIDRMTILMLKIENCKDPNFSSEFKKELETCNQAIREFEENGGVIDKKWIEKLYSINKYQWGLESSMRELKEKPENLKEIGKVYIQLQISNKKRVAVKNEVVEKTGSGFRDIKIN
jgi:hypothetical protein